MIDSPNEAVWHVLGDFGSEHRWTRSVSRCTRDTKEVRVGTVRTCELPRSLMGRSHVRESLTEFEAGRALAYQLEGPAGPFAVASSRWSSKATSSHSTAVTVEGKFEPKNSAVRILLWPLVRPMLKRLTGRILRELEEFVVLGAEARPTESP
jgi:uncharacterized protein YndB with AHSA1/START domain